MSPFTVYWLIALGVAVYLLIPIVSLRRLHRKVSRLQKPLDQLSKDMNGLLAAEETRFMKEFRQSEGKVELKTRAPSPNPTSATSSRDAIADAVLEGAAPVGSTNGAGRG